MKRQYSISVEEDVMQRIDATAKSLGLNRSSYLTFLATSIEGVLGSQEQKDEQSAMVFETLRGQSSLTK